MEVAEDLRRLHNEEIRNFYASPNIIQVIKSRRMRWEGRVARKGRDEKFIEILLENLKERNHSGDLSVDGKTM
jgi:hypothetical protein